jgi:hypothetical protein
MNTVENKLREALDERAGQTAVDTTSLWYRTNRRIQASRAKRSSRLRWVIPAVGVGALTAAGAVAVPAWLNAPERQTEQLTPAATASVSAKPSSKPSAKPATKPVKGQYAFHDAPRSAVERVAQNEGFDVDEIVPVDYVRAPEGDWLLYATNRPWDDDPMPGGHKGMGWMSLKVDDFVGGGGYGKAGVPNPAPHGGPSNKWLTSSHLLDYPHYGGDGLKSGAGLQIAAGQALPGVARVTGVDLQGREHEAKLVGKAQGWPTQEYFIVVQESVQIKTYKAYDANGKLLGSVTSEDFWDDWAD